MTQEALVAAIALICKFNNPLIKLPAKEQCLEQMVNCTVGPSGKIVTEKKVKECGEKWQIK